MRFKAFFVVAALCAFALTGSAQAPAPAPSPTKTLRPVANFVPVTDQIIRAPKPENWLIVGPMAIVNPKPSR